MQQIDEMPECAFCHAQDVELFHTSERALVVQCNECGFTSAPSFAHLTSQSITLLAG